MFAVRSFISFIAFIIFGLSFTSYTPHVEASTYATEREILEMAFQGAEIEKRGVKITSEMRKEIKALMKGRLFRLFRRRVYFYVAKRGGETLGYATVAAEIAKKERIIFMVVLEREGVVKSVDILREEKGYEIQNPDWRKQFEGKSLKDPLRLRRDIDSVSGATLSARAVTRGVKKVLAVFKIVRPMLEE